MTKQISGPQLGESIRGAFPAAVAEILRDSVVLESSSMVEVARYLKENPGLDFDYLIGLTAVDYIDYFEVVYHLASLTHNHMAIVKTRAYGRDDPTVPSLSGLWKGAELQERETYDLMGVRFSGHPHLKRIFMWEGFPGHPLRKDFLEFDHRKIAPPED